MKVNDISMGSKTDKRSEATDGTSVSAISLLKQISYLLSSSGGTGSSGEVTQDTHDSLNCNANLQVNDSDVTSVNPVPVDIKNTSLTIGQTDKTKLLGTMELSAGSTIIGKVGIDQTTDGTTNKVNATIADGNLVTLGTKADNRSTATDTTAITVMQVLKQISYMLQTAIPAGTNNIGDVDIASIAAGDNNIGNVDIVTIAAGQVVAPASTPVIYNKTCTNANTEYSQALPANCKKFIIGLQSKNTNTVWQFKLASSGTAFYLSGNESLTEENITLASQTLYFQSNVAGEIVQILAWS